LEKTVSDFPYFPLYPTDLLGDDKVIIMDLTEFGAYVRLLCLAWQQTPPATIPADDAVIAKLLGVTPEVWSGLRPAVVACWQQRGSRLHNKRLGKVYEAMMERRSKYQQAGTLGAKHRYSIAMASLKPSGNGNGSGDGTSVPEGIVKGADENAVTQPPRPPEPEPADARQLIPAANRIMARFNEIRAITYTSPAEINVCVELLATGATEAQLLEAVEFARRCYWRSDVKGERKKFAPSFVFSGKVFPGLLAEAKKRRGL